VHTQNMATRALQPIPENYRGATPYLTVKNAATAIEFYKKVFGATELMRIAAPGGKVGHAELLVGGAPLMISDEYPEMDVLAPETIGGSPVTMHLYVHDVDAVFDRAVAAGATAVRPVADQFYGDRGGKFKDPFGHAWWVATHIEDVAPEEMKKRAQELFG
jgi:PhnB protein